MVFGLNNVVCINGEVWVMVDFDMLNCFDDCG